MQELLVELGARSYPIYVGPGLLRQVDLVSRHVSGSRVAIVTNETIAPLYLAQLKAQLAPFRPIEVVLPDGEQYKTLKVLDRIFTA